VADAGDLMDFENGDLSEEEVVMLFSDLIKDGVLPHLQGFYGRTAAALVDAGYLSLDGEVLALSLDEVPC
jgi:hypothetical protein